MDIRFLVPIMVFAAGIYFSVILARALIRGRAGGAKAKRVKTKGGFATLSLALAGTLGVGNIFGVATALIIGGAGSVLWLLVSAFFSAVIKYSEVSLSLSYGKSGGIPTVLKNSFGRAGGAMAKLYALFALLLGCVMGFALQGGSLCECLYVSFGTPPLISSAVMAGILIYIVSGKNEKIKKFTATIIPLTTIVYIILALWIIFSNIERLPSVTLAILKDALSVKSGVGGAVGFITSAAVREGFCGAILSNEAGAGTSSFAHTSGEDVGALGGVVEVIFDTLILCTLTAFAVLVSVPNIESYTSGVELVLAAVYSVLGGGGIGALSFVVACFAVCTAVCWYYYSAECCRELFGGRGGAALMTAAVALTVIGAHTEGTYLVIASHYLLLFLSVLSLSVLIKNSDRVINFTLSSHKMLTKDAFSNLKRRRRRKEPKGQKELPTRSFSRSQN